MAQSPLQPSQGQIAQEDASSSILSVRPFGLRSALLLCKWPSGKAPEGESANPASYSTLACIVVIYRNIVRHLLEQKVSVEAIGQIQHALSDPSEARLWKFILCSWDPERPAFSKETIEAMLALCKILEGHASLSYTAFESSEAFKKIWESKHLQTHAAYTKGESHEWERAPYKLLPRLNLKWDGEGALETKLQHQICSFDFEDGARSIQLRWTMPLVFRISYQSKTEMPGIFERIRSLELYDPALPEEQKSASAPYHYRLFGVVRTAKAQDDPIHDLVRVYNPFGDKTKHHVYPDSEFESILFPSTWTLSEPNRRFFLYYGLVKEHFTHPEFTPREVPRDRIAWMRDPRFAELLRVPVGAEDDRLPADEPVSTHIPPSHGLNQLAPSPGQPAAAGGQPLATRNQPSSTNQRTGQNDDVAFGRDVPRDRGLGRGSTSLGGQAYSSASNSAEGQQRQGRPRSGRKRRWSQMHFDRGQAVPQAPLADRQNLPPFGGSRSGPDSWRPADDYDRRQEIGPRYGSANNQRGYYDQGPRREYYNQIGCYEQSRRREHYAQGRYYDQGPQRESRDQRVYYDQIPQREQHNQRVYSDNTFRREGTPRNRTSASTRGREDSRRRDFTTQSLLDGIINGVNILAERALSGVETGQAPMREQPLQETVAPPATEDYPTEPFGAGLVLPDIVFDFEELVAPPATEDTPTEPFGAGLVLPDIVLDYEL